MNSDHCERTCINGGQAAAEARIVGPVLAVGAEDAVAGDALVPLTQQTRQQKVVSLYNRNITNNVNSLIYLPLPSLSIFGVLCLTSASGSQDVLSSLQ